MNKFCVYCGKELDNNCKFCYNCGAEVGITTDSDNINDSTDIKNEVNSEFTVSNFNSKTSKYVNTMAIIGLVSSILSYFLCCGLLSLPSLIFSIIGLCKANKNGGEGRGMSIVGIVLSIIPIAFFILNILLNFVTVEDDGIYNTDIMMILFSL